MDERTKCLLKDAAAHLESVAADRAFNEAKRILQFVLQKTDLELVTESVSISPAEQKQFEELIKRRIKREPLAYLIGEKEFYGRKFFVSPGVFIPRPESETLIDSILRRFPSEASFSALEICSGSGCLSITLGAERKNSRILSLEISPLAFEASEKNKKLYQLSNVRFENADSRDFVKANRESFELIFSNPPYIPVEEMPNLDVGILDFEPHLALEAGEKGLEFYDHIFKDWIGFLKPSGYLVLETYDEEQRENIRQRYSDLPGVFIEEECVLIWQKNER